jgi:HEAT repeats
VPWSGQFARFMLGPRRIGAAPSVWPGRALARVAATIGLSCLTWPGGAVAESPAAATDLSVTVAEGRLSVRVAEAPLEAVLEAIAAQTDVAITIRGDPGTVRPQAFADLPLDLGIRRLAGERGLMMMFARANDRGAPGRLREVRVYGDRPSDDVARPRHPLTRTLGRIAAEPPPRLEPPSYEELAKKGKAERLMTLRILARQQDDAAIALLGALAAQDPDATVRRIAATALGNIGGETAAAALEPALADADVEVRIQAMRGLHVISGEAAAGPLGELAVGDADPGLRRQAVHLLATLRSDAAWSTVELASSDPDASVREAAEEALSSPRKWRRAK